MIFYTIIYEISAINKYRQTYFTSFMDSKPSNNNEISLKQQEDGEWVFIDFYILPLSLSLVISLNFDIISNK
jgi:hypothetical protein